MIDVIINNSLRTVAKSGRLIERARCLVAGDPNLQNELDQLQDVVFLLQDAANLLRRTFEARPEIARGLLHTTLQ